MTIKAATYKRELPISGDVTENESTTSEVKMQQKKIAELAFYKAEKRGFDPGSRT